MTPLFSIPFAIITLETLVKDNFLLEKSYSILILIDTKAFHGESHFFSLKKTAFSAESHISPSISSTLYIKGLLQHYPSTSK